MQMKDRLACVGADVIDSTETALKLAFACNLCRHKLAIAHQFRICFRRLINPDNMLFRNDQHMRGRLRIDVLKRKSFFVFIDFLGGDFAGNDLAEKTVSHNQKS